jgi:hypothetical protein
MPDLERFQSVILTADIRKSISPVSTLFQLVLLTNYMETNRLLGKPNVYYRVHKSPPLVPILTCAGPGHTLTFCFFKICFNIIFQYTVRLDLTTGLYPSGFPTKACHAFLVSLMTLDVTPIKPSSTLSP